MGTSRRNPQAGLKVPPSIKRAGTYGKELKPFLFGERFLDNAFKVVVKVLVKRDAIFGYGLIMAIPFLLH